MERYAKASSMICSLVACVIACAALASAQEKRAEFEHQPCESGRISWEWNGQKSSQYRECRTIELRLPASSGELNVDAGRFGGIGVTGWDRPEVLVSARVEVWNDDVEFARRLAAGVRIETNDDQIRAVVPPGEENRYFSVSFGIFVPRDAALKLTTSNGGIYVRGTRGRVEFKALNGGATLVDLAGDVRGETTNGGLFVRLAGAEWDGVGLDARTTNGGVTVEVPEGFAAQLVAETKWGGVKNDFADREPVGSVKNKNKNEAVTLNPEAGGATVRVATTNGGVRIKRRAAS